MLKNKTSLCISYITCPTVYVIKHLSCHTYERVPTCRNPELHFMTPGPGVLVSECGHIGREVKMPISLKILFSTTEYNSVKLSTCI